MKQFAKTSWTVGDVQTLFNVTDEQAETFLVKNQNNLQDQIIQHGWDVLQTMGEMDDLDDLDVI